MQAQPLTPQARRAFLEALSDTGIVTRACQAVGVSNTLAYAWRKADKEFEAAWDLALAVGIDKLEDHVKVRGFEGYDEPVVYQGSLTPVWEYDEQGEVKTAIRYDADGEVRRDAAGNETRYPVQARNPDGSLKWLTVKKFSDSLAIRVLMARLPAYKDKSDLNVTGNLNMAEAIVAARKRSKPPAAPAPFEPDDFV